MDDNDVEDNGYNITSTGAVSAAKSTLGGIDIVVNNAGIGDEGDKWEHTVDINVVSVKFHAQFHIDFFLIHLSTYCLRSYLRLESLQVCYSVSDGSSPPHASGNTSI